jgi:hypothetical protein
LTLAADDVASGGKRHLVNSSKEAKSRAVLRGTRRDDRGVYRSGRLLEFSELLIDLEEDRYARTVVLGMLAELEAERRHGR